MSKSLTVRPRQILTFLVNTIQLSLDIETAGRRSEKSDGSEGVEGVEGG